MSLGFVCDFETLATNTEYTYVWAWASCDISNTDNVVYGNDINSFAEWCKNIDTVYFHNLGFDGAFIIDFLYRSGFTYSETKGDKTFKIIKADNNALYMIEVIWEYQSKKKFKATKIYDSFKKLPFSVSAIAKGWGLEETKLDIDYKAHREETHIMTDQEREYIKNDVVIVAKALNSLLTGGHKKMTIGADALTEFKLTKTKQELESFIPTLPADIDTYCRKAYKGGFTYVRNDLAGKDIKDGIVFDVNSLYPSRMYFDDMPFGKPLFFEGKYNYDKFYPLYICTIRVNFELKPKHIPCIQIKNNRLFQATEYLTSSNNEMVEMTVSCVDLQLIFEQYNIIAIDYINGYKFKACKGLFKDYIDKFMKIKKENKGAKRQEAKLFLNNLYGKLATNPVRQSKIPYFDNEKDIVRYKMTEPEIGEGVYLPMGVFITAYARAFTIRQAQKLYDRFIYADTDSLHLIGTEIPQDLPVDDKELGKWACEGTFTKARFIRPKTYIEEKEGKLCVTCAGLPGYCHSQVTWDNFKRGTTYYGKLKPTTVKGGVVLTETSFKIS